MEDALVLSRLSSFAKKMADFTGIDIADQDYIETIERYY